MPTAFQFIRAVSRKNYVQVEAWIRQGQVNVNIQDERGTTALHAAVMNRDARMVALLLQYNGNPIIRNQQGHSVLDLAQYISDPAVMATLFPQQAFHIQQRKQRMEGFQQQRAALYQPLHKFNDLRNLGANYQQKDDVPALDPQVALQMMKDAIHYMAMHIFKANEYPQISDEAYSAEQMAFSMCQTLAAGARIINTQAKAITQKYKMINWQALSLFIRTQQYHPFFISHMLPAKRQKLIHVALHELVFSGDMDRLQDALQNIMQNQPVTTPLLTAKFERLHYFFADEAPAQYLDDAITNFKSCHHKDNAYQKHVRLLRSLMVAGEALHELSPALKIQIGYELTEKICDLRNILCHPERPYNLWPIEDFLFSKSNEIRGFQPVQLMKQLLGKQPITTAYLQCYDTPLSVENIWPYLAKLPYVLPMPDQPETGTATHHTPHNFYSIEANYCQQSKNAPAEQASWDQLFREQIEARFLQLQTIAIHMRTDKDIEEMEAIELRLEKMDFKQNIATEQQCFKDYLAKYFPGESRTRNFDKNLKNPKKNIENIDKILKKISTTISTSREQKKSSRSPH